jgi:rod shape-determining protein MreD
MVATALAQVTWAPHFEVAGAFPNLVLLGAAAVTWTHGQRAGMAWACAGGLLLDLGASGPVGPHAVALLAGVYAIGFWTRNLEQPAAVHTVLAAAATTIIYSAVLVLTDGLLGLAVPQPDIAARLAFAAAAYNALLMPLALEVLRRLQAVTRSTPEVS